MKIASLAAAFLLLSIGSYAVLLRHPAVNTNTVTIKSTNLQDNQTSVSDKQVTRLTIPADQAVFITGPIFDVRATVQELKDKAKNHDDLYLLIDSPGGSVLDGSQVISQMESSTAKVHTICTGLCASMAFMIFEFGTTRLAVDRSVLMAHPASGGVQGTLEQMQSRLSMITRYVDKLNASVANRLPMPFLNFKTLIVSEMWLDAEDAIARNFADKIVTVDTDIPTEHLINLPQDKIKKPREEADLIWM